MVDRARVHSDQSGSAGDSFLPGEHVRIRLGALSGLEGVVVGVTSAGNCMLTIDGIASGLRVIISSKSLEPMGRETAEDQSEI